MQEQRCCWQADGGKQGDGGRQGDGSKRGERGGAAANDEGVGNCLPGAAAAGEGAGREGRWTEWREMVRHIQRQTTRKPAHATARAP